MSDIVERLREVAERPDANYPAIMEQAAAEIEQLEAALRGIKWRSADRDNMEFAATITYSQMDAIRAALEDKCTSS